MSHPFPHRLRRPRLPERVRPAQDCLRAEGPGPRHQGRYRPWAILPEGRQGGQKMLQKRKMLLFNVPSHFAFLVLNDSLLTYHLDFTWI